MAKRPSSYETTPEAAAPSGLRMIGRDWEHRNGTEVFEPAMNRASTARRNPYSHVVFADQRTGNVYHNGELIARGVTGNDKYGPKGLLNPAAQGVRMSGPVPRNVYSLGPLGISNTPGVGLRSQLAPGYEKLMFGRDQMAMHSGHLNGALGSQGCLSFDVLPQFKRVMDHLGKNGVKLLQVFDSGRLPGGKFDPALAAADLEKELRAMHKLSPHAPLPAANGIGARQNPIHIAQLERARGAPTQVVSTEPLRLFAPAAEHATGPGPHAAPEQQPPRAAKDGDAPGLMSRLGRAIGYVLEQQGKAALAQGELYKAQAEAIGGLFRGARDAVSPAAIAGGVRVSDARLPRPDAIEAIIAPRAGAAPRPSAAVKSADMARAKALAQAALGEPPSHARPRAPRHHR